MHLKHLKQSKQSSKLESIYSSDVSTTTSSPTLVLVSDLLHAIPDWVIHQDLFSLLCISNLDKNRVSFSLVLLLSLILTNQVLYII